MKSVQIFLHCINFFNCFGMNFHLINFLSIKFFQNLFYANFMKYIVKNDASLFQCFFVFQFVVYLLKIFMSSFSVLSVFSVVVTACTLIFNLISCLAMFCVDPVNGVGFGLAILWALLFTPCSFVCWYRPVYKAFRYVQLRIST